MAKNWWKGLAVVLILYTIAAGLLVPLKGGILDISPERLALGKANTLTVKGYNTNFTGFTAPRAWLKFDDTLALMSQKITVQDAQTLAVTFDLPPFLPTKDLAAPLTFVLDDPTEGVALMPAAITAVQDSANEAQGKNAWKGQIKDVHWKKVMAYPFRSLLYETIRNLFFHVPMWFTMMYLLFRSVLYSIAYLRRLNKGEGHLNDTRAEAYARVGTLFGVLGFLTGMLWAKHTWGSYLTTDVKLISAGVCVLIYFAYFIFRGSFEDTEKAARFSAVYNIFAFASLPALLFILPRLTDSLHPGNGGNPAFGSQDLDNVMRLVFYPANIGWILLGTWIAQIVLRYEILKDKILSKY